MSDVKPDPIVRVQVLRAISCGGKYYGLPKRGEPAVEAVMPQSAADSYGPDYVKVIGPAAADKQIKPGEAKTK